MTCTRITFLLAIVLCGSSTTRGQQTSILRVPSERSEVQRAQQDRTSEWAIPSKFENSIGMKFVLIPPGQFAMGPNGSTYQVTINKPYYAATTEVTLGQYRCFRRAHQIEGADQEFNHENRPAAMLSWIDANAYCQWLTDQPAEQNAGRVYSLPTEAQWEWMARAGQANITIQNESSMGLSSLATFNSTGTPNPKLESAGRGRQIVGQLTPNAWGLYDTLGNVWEWCADRRSNPITGEEIQPVMRGGSWRSGAFHCSPWAHDPADERSKGDNIGFRIVCAAPEPVNAASRRSKVAHRRSSTYVICHRGASEFAHENTLESYRTTFELGADGNEIDIRQTKDGVLICFHDDMLDQILEAFGDTQDYTWSELRAFPFRNPRQFGRHCRIPTLAEVLMLHRSHGGLIHLDIKRAQIDTGISKLISQFDMWEHIISCPVELGAAIVQNKQYHAGSYKGGLYLDHSEVFPTEIQRILKLPGEGVIVDDPRGVLVELRRKIGPISMEPATPAIHFSVVRKDPVPAERFLVDTLRNQSDWNVVAHSDSELLASANRITLRARAADQLSRIRIRETDTLAALEERVRNRSLHQGWQYHGLDGAMSLRALIRLKAPQAVDMARFALWRDDPELIPVMNPVFKNPRSWTDFRVKMVVFPALSEFPGSASEKLCRDYLTLSDNDARQLGPDHFEAAALALLKISPTTATALELMQHRLQVVRGRAILHCLCHQHHEWALRALEQGAPHALAYRLQL